MMDGYIAVAGSLNYDILVKQERLPEKGETYTADSVAYEGGGKGANQAVQCAKLGVPTYLVGKVGQDVFGDVLLRKLETYGVQTDHISRSGQDTGLGIVHVLNDGAVYATIITGANFDFQEEDIKKIEAVAANSKILILQMEIPIPVVEDAIGFAKAHGVYVILNAAPAKAISREALAKVDCLVVNESEATYYAGVTISDPESAQANFQTLTSLTDGIVIITLGEKGSLLCRGDQSSLIPAVKPEAVVETTGAGDSYIGAFAYCKYIGKTDAEACNFAARVSSVTVTKVGAQGAMPYLHELSS